LAGEPYDGKLSRTVRERGITLIKGSYLLVHSHIGFILLALAINTEQSIDSLIFYIIQYSITNLNTFLIIIALGYTIQLSFIRQFRLEIVNRNINNYSDVITVAEPKFNKFNNFKNFYKFNNFKGGRNEKVDAENDIKFISEFKGQFFLNPLLSLSFTICLFSMAGINEVCLL
jgi:NADH-ubiquinone oxidoreductase chain 2